MQHEGIMRSLLLAVGILAVLACFVMGCILWNSYQAQAAEQAYWEIIREEIEV